MTDSFVKIMEVTIADCERQNLRKASVIMSRIVMDLSTPLCRAYAAGVAHLTSKSISKDRMVGRQEKRS